MYWTIECFHKLSPDIIKMYTKFDFVLYLNLQFWHFFDKIYSSEYVIRFLLRLDLFQILNVTLNRNNIWYEIANIVAFSFTRPYTTKYSPFKKKLHSTQNYSSFYKKMCNLIIRNLF